MPAPGTVNTLLRRFALVWFTCVLFKQMAFFWKVASQHASIFLADTLADRKEIIVPQSLPELMNTGFIKVTHRSCG
ncbi:MAG: hypothetical protein CML20_14820 [Rheinheimera sp.]|nr:hypothetical protein [Rheinheimera sp.]